MSPFSDSLFGIPNFWHDAGPSCVYQKAHTKAQSESHKNSYPAAITTGSAFCILIADLASYPQLATRDIAY